MIDNLIARYDLKPHPEGGFYAETYRSAENIVLTNGGAFPTNRSFGTAIYFLLVSDSFSAFHKIKSDEIWHFYSGSPIEIIEITPEGECISTVLGQEYNEGQVFQYTVLAGNWFASRVLNNQPFGFVGCTVAPGFSFEDFEMPTRAQLLENFPQHKQLIEELTR